MVSLKNIKVNVNVDTTDFIKSLRQLQEIIKMDDVRILKGWTKEEREELEEVKETKNLGHFLHIITGYPEDTDCGYVWDKYDKAKTQDQFIIIKDIVDFYFDKAKFPEQKYYIELLKEGLSRYINLNLMVSVVFLGSNKRVPLIQNEFTEQEIKDIEPRYMAFAVPVEDK